MTNEQAAVVLTTRAKFLALHTPNHPASLPGALDEVDALFRGAAALRIVDKTTPIETEAHYSATVFVYRYKETGKIVAYFMEDARKLVNDPKWELVASLDPRAWIAAHYKQTEATFLEMKI